MAVRINIELVTQLPLGWQHPFIGLVTQLQLGWQHPFKLDCITTSALIHHFREGISAQKAGPIHNELMKQLQLGWQYPFQLEW